MFHICLFQINVITTSNLGLDGLMLIFNQLMNSNIFLPVH